MKWAGSFFVAAVLTRALRGWKVVGKRKRLHYRPMPGSELSAVSGEPSEDEPAAPFGDPDDRFGAGIESEMVVLHPIAEDHPVLGHERSQAQLLAAREEPAGDIGAGGLARD